MRSTTTYYSSNYLSRTPQRRAMNGQPPQRRAIIHQSFNIPFTNKIMSSGVQRPWNCSSRSCSKLHFQDPTTPSPFYCMRTWQSRTVPLMRTWQSRTVPLILPTTWESREADHRCRGLALLPESFYYYYYPYLPILVLRPKDQGVGAILGCPVLLFANSQPEINQKTTRNQLAIHSSWNSNPVILPTNQTNQQSTINQLNHIQSNSTEVPNSSISPVQSCHYFLRLQSCHYFQS